MRLLLLAHTNVIANNKASKLRRKTHDAADVHTQEGEFVEPKDDMSRQIQQNVTSSPTPNNNINNELYDPSTRVEEKPVDKPEEEEPKGEEDSFLNEYLLPISIVAAVLVSTIVILTAERSRKFFNVENSVEDEEEQDTDINLNHYSNGMMCGGIGMCETVHESCVKLKFCNK